MKPTFCDIPSKLTVASWITQNDSLIPRYWMHDNNIKNKDGETLKDLMIQQHMPIPQHWENNNDMNIFDQAYFGKVPDITGHKSNEQDEQGFTVAMILLYNDIQIPKEWEHDLNIQNKYGSTIFSLSVLFRKIPPKWACVEPTKLFHPLITQALILAKYNIPVPEYLYHDPNICDINGFTVALHQAQFGKIPDEHWKHDKYLRDKCRYMYQHYTVQNYLQKRKVKVPDYWRYEVADDVDQTKAMQYARRGQIPPEQYYHNPEYCNIFDTIVGMYLCYFSIIPPRQWMHNIYTVNVRKESIQYILQERQLPVPRHWKENEQLTIFDQACYGQIPDITEHQSNEQNEDGFTIAMILTINKIDIPKEWYHDPNIRNMHGYTVAMYQARDGKIPDKIWEHSKFLRGIIQDRLQEYYTVQNFLQQKEVQVPDQWKYDTLDKDENTQAMIQAKNGQIPDKQFNHDPLQINMQGNTVEDYLISNNLDVPIEWQTNPNRILSENDKQIVQDYCKYYNIKVNYNISPTYNITQYKTTIALYLAEKCIIPPQTWTHNLYLETQGGRSIRYFLYTYKYSYENDQFIPTFKTEIIDRECPHCHNKGKQEFVISEYDLICLNCFKKRIEHNKIRWREANSKDFTYARI